MFASGRVSTGAQHKGEEPDDAMTFSREIVFPLSFVRPVREGAVYLAEVMEDKWDVFFYGSALYFARSWSGQLIYRAELERPSGRENEPTVVREFLNMDACRADRALAARQLEFDTCVRDAHGGSASGAA